MRAPLIALFLLGCSSSNSGDPARPGDAPEAESSADQENGADGELGSDGTAEQAAPGPEPTATCTFLTDQGEVVVAVEVAAAPQDRMRGLMFRESLAPDHGMVFIFPDDDTHPFWMRNTYLSLDIIHIDKDLNVVGVIANAEPLSEEQRKIDVPSRYVVEVIAGYAAEHAIVEDTRVVFNDVPLGVEN